MEEWKNKNTLHKNKSYAMVKYCQKQSIVMTVEVNQRQKITQI